MKLLCTAVFLSSIALAAPNAAKTPGGEEGWTRFRGPNGSGVATGALPSSLSPTEDARWKVDLPGGYSSPVVSPTSVFLTAVDGVELRTYALDRATGEVRWQAKAPVDLEQEYRRAGSPVAPSPACDGENVYVFFPNQGLLSYDAAGKERWRLELEPFNSPYGMGSSPIVEDGTLILICDQDTDSYLLAVDTETGKERWRAPRPGFTHGYASPVVARPEDGPAQVLVSGSYQLASYSLESGTKLWWTTGMAWQAKSTPIVADEVVFVHSWMAAPTELGVKKISTPWEEALVAYDQDGDELLAKDEVSELGLVPLWFLNDLNKDELLDEQEWDFVLARGTAQNGMFAIQLGGEGDVTEKNRLWRYRRALPNIPSPLLYEGVLYMVKEGGILTALDPASGEELSDGRVEGAMDAYFASPVAADGKLLLASHPGNVVLLSAGPEPEVQGLWEFGEEIWATPAVDGGQVFIRTQEALYAFAATED